MAGGPDSKGRKREREREGGGSRIIKFDNLIIGKPLQKNQSNSFSPCWPGMQPVTLIAHNHFNDYANHYCNKGQ